MNCFVDTIVAGRRPRPVRVERKRRRPWCLRDVHAMGIASVADELGLAAMLDMGGIMTGARRRALLMRKVASAAVGRRDIGCAMSEATKPEIPVDLSTGGLLAEDVRRLFARSPKRCPRELYETRV